MNALNVFLIILVLSASGLAKASEPPKAIDDADANVQNFDSQVIDIFKGVVENPQVMPGTTDVGTDDQKAALKTIYKKFIDHEMFLKNVVYRTDINVIRVTWGDRKNEYIVKVSYKTGKDKVLSNSVYADKKAVLDVKIMYRKPDSEFDYIDLLDTRLFENGRPVNHVENAHDVYYVQYKLPDEQCGFCHTLAKYDNSPSGIFFPRYQEGQGTDKLGSMSTFFDPGKLELRKKEESANLGLPEMKDDFYFFKVTKTSIYENDKNSQKIMRTLIELPQLLEVLSMDNHKSYCLLTDTGEVGKNLGFGRDDYICADNVARKLHVKMTDSSITNKNEPIIYTEAYFKK
jgi:hypothetical protein